MDMNTFFKAFLHDVAVLMLYYLSLLTRRMMILVTMNSSSV
jgi:hypothetical protein